MTLNCIAVDDEPAGLNRIVKCIEKNPFLTLIYSTADATNAKHYIEANTFDLLITDIDMPNYSGFDLANSTQKSFQVIFVTGYQNFALEAINKNAVAVLQKPFRNENFNDAIEKVHKLKYYENATKIENNIIEKYNLLTASEKEVIDMIGQGLESKEIAELKFIEAKTIENHRQNIRKKLGFSGKSDMTIFAYEVNKLKN